MPRIVTGELSYAAAVRDYEEKTYTYGSRAYFGSGVEGNVTTKDYGLFFTPVSGEMQDVAKDAIQELRIRLTIKKKTTTDTQSEFVYRLYSSAQSWSGASGLYNNVINGGNEYEYAWVTFPNTLESTEIVIALTGTEAYYAAQYGFSISNGGLSDIAEITAYSLEADVSDRYVPPVVSLTNGFGKVVDGKYWHYPQNQFTLVLDYSQETGEPIGQITLDITLRNGIKRRIYGTIGNNSVDVPGYYWEDLPQSGTLEIRVDSEAGVYAETITMPFEVAQYDIRYTSHTSGAIVQSDEDITINWEAVLPDTLPVSLIVPPPTKYVCYVWYDDADRESGVAIADTTRTIPAAHLTGKNTIHVAVTEKYGDGVSARYVDYAPVLNLYIQQVADVGGVTVGDKWVNDVYFPGITVSWESTGQTAFQVRVGDVYDSGPVWGTATTYKVPLILNDGVYPVTVRIQDSNGMWGDWTSPVWITIKDMYEAKHNALTAIKQKEGVELTVTLTDSTPADYSSILLYRNGIMIEQLEPSDTLQYLDRAAIGLCTYWARFVSAVTTAYESTESVTVDATPETDGMILQDGTWLALRYTDEFPRRYPSSVGEEVYARYYSGREYPVYMRSGRKDESITMTYTDKGNVLADRMEELAGTCVLYKTTNGQRIYGILERVQAERGRKRCRVTFVLRRANFEDAVPYTWPEE